MTRAEALKQKIDAGRVELTRRHESVVADLIRRGLISHDADENEVLRVLTREAQARAGVRVDAAGRPHLSASGRPRDRRPSGPRTYGAPSRGKRSERDKGLRLPDRGNPKIFDADVKGKIRGWKPIGITLSMTRLRRAWRQYGSNGLKLGLLEKVYIIILLEINEARCGYARITYEGIVQRLSDDWMEESVRLALRWLEHGHLLDTFNVTNRYRGEVRRDANLYLVPDLPVDPDRPFGADIEARKSRWAGHFGLKVRELGLNVTAAVKRGVSSVASRFRKQRSTPPVEGASAVEGDHSFEKPPFPD